MATHHDQRRTVVDIRPTHRDETVVCDHRDHAIQPWAQYCVSWRWGDEDDRTRPGRLYLCRKCLTEFLVFADGLGVG